MKKMVLFVFLCALSLDVYAVHSVTLEIFVHDEKGQPIEGALVRGFFFQDQIVDKFARTTHGAVTDETGTAILAGREELYVDLNIEKRKYYPSKKRAQIRGARSVRVNILLRERRNPIAMYARRVVVELPGVGQEYGFDFFKGDLVGSARSGINRDVSLTINNELLVDGGYTQTMTMRFPGESDGAVLAEDIDAFQDSYFKSRYEAPVGGYAERLIVLNERGSTESRRENFGVPFYIKIRTLSESEDGEEQANYCKIWPGVKLYGVRAEKPSFSMTYYCNPQRANRNVEFDPNKNLYQSLPYNEKVLIP